MLGYNYFLRRVKSVVADLDEFAHDFVNLAQRATYRIERPIKPSDVRNQHSSGNSARERVPTAVVGGKNVIAQARSAE